MSKIDKDMEALAGKLYADFAELEPTYPEAGVFLEAIRDWFGDTIMNLYVRYKELNED